MEKLNLQFVSDEIEEFNKNIRFSKLKILIQLFISSFILLSIIFPIYLKYAPSPLFRFYLISPFIINVFAWSYWIVRVTGFFRFFEISRKPYSLRKDLDYDGFDAIYNRYEMLQYLMIRESMFERVINMLTGIQFIFMLILPILLFFYY